MKISFDNFQKSISFLQLICIIFIVSFRISVEYTSVLLAFALFFQVFTYKEQLIKFVVGFIFVLLVLSFIFLKPTMFYPVLFILISCYYLWRKSSFKDHLLIYLTTIISFFICIILFESENELFLFFEILFLFFVVISSFALLLRHDIEHHHIIKHRLGLQSRRVEVKRLLNSKKVLEQKLLGFILGTSLIITFSGLICAYFFIPYISRLYVNNGYYHSDFPDSFNLNSIGRVSVTKEKRLNVRIVNGKFPNRLYLKNKVFTKYKNGIWSSDNEPFSEFFKVEGELNYEIEIQDYKNSNNGFKPVEKVSIELKNSRLKVYINKFGVVQFDKIIHSPKYRISIFKNSKKKNISVDEYLQLPKNLPRKIKILGKELFKNSGKKSDRIMRVLNYLKKLKYSENYGIVSSNEDPVEKFLFKTKNGPCGLFASSAVLLFRLGNIPSRLAIGFSNSTKNRKSIIFRGKDAHSWVEIYKDGKWQIIDPTANVRVNLITMKKTDSNKGILGRVILVILPVFIIIIILLVLIFKYMKKSVSSPEIKRTIRIKPVKPPSITTFEVSMIFSELINSKIFQEISRDNGETALNYGLRLKGKGHKNAKYVITASKLANRVLFSEIDKKEKEEILIKLKSILKKFKI
jgi:Transglutaminase-like superfamily